MRMLHRFLFVLLVGGCCSSAIAVSFQPGDIIITEFFDGWHKIDPVSHAISELALPYSRSSHLAMDKQGRLLFTDGTDSICRFDPAGGLSTPLPVENVNFIDGFIVEPAGSLLIADDDSLDRFVEQPPRTTPLTDRTFFAPNGITQTSDGRVFITEFFEDLWEFVPATGALLPVTTVDLDLPGLITARPSGDLILRDHENRLQRVDPDTGGVTLFSDDLPDFPHAITVEADGDVLMTSTEGVFRFDAATGVRSTLATGTFFNPFGIVVVPESTTSPTLPGDYNNDGLVDAIDYAVWREDLGGSASFDLWRQSYGATRPASGDLTGSVPEPIASCLLAIALLSGHLFAERRRQS